MNPATFQKMSSFLNFVCLPKRCFTAAVHRTRRPGSTTTRWRAIATSNSIFLDSEAYARDAEGDEIAGSNKRTSALGIQMISKSLHKQIFGEEPHISKDAVEKSKKHLNSHGINIKTNTSELSDSDVDLPPLLGRDINEHFVKIARQQTEPYLSLAKSLVNANLPQMPKKWSFVPGWTKYDEKKTSSVAYPDEDALVLDVEVCIRDSERPVLATAVSCQHWYSWVSERLVAHEDYDVGVQGRTTPRYLIPLESDPDSSEHLGGKWRERVVVGHNVSYDRARIREQYLMKVSTESATVHYGHI